MKKSCAAPQKTDNILSYAIVSAYLILHSLDGNAGVISSTPTNNIMGHAPVASDLRLLVDAVPVTPGSVAVGNTIELGYTFNDNDGDTESNSLFRFFSNENLRKSGLDNNYVINSGDIGSTLRACITPKTNELTTLPYHGEEICFSYPLIDESKATISERDLIVTKNGAVADGVAANIIQATVTDGNNNKLPGQIVTFAADNHGSVTPVEVVTDSDGIATTSITNTYIGTTNVTASVNGMSRSVNTSFVLGDTVVIAGVGHFSYPIQVRGPNLSSITRDCDSLVSGGFSDWRVPTIDELSALRAQYPSLQIHTVLGWPIFPGATDATGNYYVSNTPDPATPGWYRAMKSRDPADIESNMIWYQSVPENPTSGAHKALTCIR